MWRARRVLCGRLAGAYRLCSSNRAQPSASSSSPVSPALRGQAEKQRRRRVKERAILSSQHSNTGDHELTWSEKEEIKYTAQTPPGQKKDTTVPFPSSYSPEYVESSWYQWWEKEGFFTPEHHERLAHAVDQSFSLCIPPPNVTGSLHLGHALTVAIEDTIFWVNYKTVVEKRLQREGKHRRDLSREEFLQEVWKWKNDKGDEIYHQLRKLGASLDWNRACFTMDPGFSKAVTEAFVRLCDSDLIYRSERLVNWSCALESAISDIEVESKELFGQTMLSVPGYQEKVEFGTMVTFAYPIDGHDGEVAVSTTRPETMLGDVAIAVHPDDPRYKDVHGKHCRHPFTNRVIPIVTDTMVDMELGTGAVKVTPAHDHMDFLLAQRHSLPHLTVIGGDGTMMPHCGQWLKVILCFSSLSPPLSRSGDIVEPLLKKQWFLRCDEMAKRAIQVTGVSFLVSVYGVSIMHLCLCSICSDWCISRQLWWGHQIPAYHVELPSSSDKQEEQWVWGRSEDEARQRAAIKYGVKMESITLTRDTDVLDTWFSSGLFPFAMLGWPEQTSDLQQYYPNSILETGSDLIFFWVARMVMLGTELTGQLPFKKVLLHSLMRDKHGRKMSKSLGNVIDPLDVISGISLEVSLKDGNLHPRERTVAMEAQRKDFPKGIPQCGTDALRFALCSYKMQGEDINLSVSQVLSCRHFCNKMWQTLRFTLGVLGDKEMQLGTLEETTPLSSVDRWVCSRLYSTVLQCERGFEAYELHAVTSALYSFWVHSLCDTYMECIKPVLGNNVLYHCVSVSLALLSPFMPFLTEELWQRLQPFRPDAAKASLCLQPYPSSTQLVRQQSQSLLIKITPLCPLLSLFCYWI
uniref:Valine--tRNA ligase, mitochondrial n=1 Tax=Myripristis murdjan TaxID=586833 RepID=A0A667XSK3_9TELE